MKTEPIDRARASRARRTDAGYRRIEIWVVPADLDAGIEAGSACEPCRPPPGVHAMSWVLGWVRGNEMRLGPSQGVNLKSENQEI